MRYRVLVVEDHEWWRRYISSALEQTSQWEVVGAVSDGIEAVQKARELKPDVILLDVGLPGLNGIQAARRMLAHDPSSRILFVSEQQSLDVAEVALGAGARGYIVKSKVGRELLPAMEAVVEGQRFVSAKLAGRGFQTTNDGRVVPEIRWHEAGFYTDESSLLDDYASFAETALDAGNGLVMVVTSSRRDRLYQRLQARGIDIDRIIKERSVSGWMCQPPCRASWSTVGLTKHDSGTPRALSSWTRREARSETGLVYPPVGIVPLHSCRTAARTRPFGSSSCGTTWPEHTASIFSAHIHVTALLATMRARSSAPFAQPTRPFTCDDAP